MHIYTHITLEAMRFYAYHGVGAQETAVGNEFTVSLRLKTDFMPAALSDDVNDTISYADVQQLVKEEMNIPSRLLEHVCHRIGKRLLHEFPSIEELEIKLSKRNPPMGADIEAAGVEILYTR